MLRHIKTKAFTLSEMIVVTVITSIVVGLAFSILNLVQKQMKSVTENYSGTTQLQLLEQALWIDFHTYHSISYHPETDELRFKHELDTVVYRFTKDKVIKDRDTFFIPVKNKLFYNQGDVIPKGFADAFQWQAAAENQGKQYFVFKTNDATHIINSWHFN